MYRDLMNDMKKKTTIYTALAILMPLLSCSQEGPGGGLSEEGQRIYFRSYLPTVETRAGVLSNENLTECQVSCLNPYDANLIDSSTGLMKTYFSDMHFAKHADGYFLAENGDSTRWPNSTDRLHFFAYYPPVASLQENINAQKFNLVNRSVSKDGTPTFDYRMEGFQVAQDIADQVDLVAAYANGTLQENSNSGLRLNFSHQLARIEISAWGESAKYDFEIAGVRIGNPITEGDFNFSSLLPNANGTTAWLNTAGNQGVVEHIFTTGESIVSLSKTAQSHSTADNAASIMGNAGPAMVIPMNQKIEAWEGKADPEINAAKYSTDKLYFSVLLRVTNMDNEEVYPYHNNCDFIPVIYLAVKNNGKVIRRVYLIDEEYYTADKKSEELKYVPGENEKVRGFCWAALPLGAKWEAGKIYTYKLNYTTGIGWHDPSDPTPGEPIIERGKVPFEVDVEEWVAAEDYNPNLDVPKR